MFCTRCGHENPDDARFCAQCGAPLSRAEYAASPDATSIFQPGTFDEGGIPDEPADEHAGAVDALSSGLGAAGGQARARTRAPGSSSTRRRYHRRSASGERHLPGRRDGLPSARGVPPGRPRASRCPTSASLNGTYVNREPIEVAALTNGDEVQIGKFRLVFLSGDQAQGDTGS